MNQRTCIIFNPAAKGERAKRLLGELRERIPDMTLMMTSGPGDALSLADRAVEEGFEILVAAGGDGTVNEVVNGIAGREVTLGVLPMGTVNVFAMELGIPGDWSRAVEVLRHGKSRRIDLARAAGRWFVQLAGVGLDAQAVQETSSLAKKNWGPLSYVIAASQVIGRPPPLLRVDTYNGKLRECSLMLIGNGRYYGGPFSFFPEAKLDDGLLDVCLFEKMSHLDVFRYLQGIIRGRHTGYADVHYFKTERLRVESDSEVPVEVDGELHTQTPISFEVVPSGLSVICP